MSTQPVYVKGIKMARHVTSELREGITDQNDCFIFAVMHATGVTYRDAHAYVTANFKRTRRGGTYVGSGMIRLSAAASCIFGYRVTVKRTETTILRRGYGVGYRFETLSSALPRLRTGRYIVCSGSHAFAVIDGVVYDNGIAGGRTQVHEVYELKASSQFEREEREAARCPANGGGL